MENSLTVLKNRVQKFFEDYLLLIDVKNLEASFVKD